MTISLCTRTHSLHCRIEKDCTNWAHDRLKELFIQQTAATATTTAFPAAKITAIDGDVSVNQRKGKVKQLFDLELSIDLGVDGRKCRVAEFTADADEVGDLELKGFTGGSGGGEGREELLQCVFEVLKRFKSELHATHGLPLLVEAGCSSNDGSTADGVNATAASVSQSANQAAAYLASAVSPPAQSTSAATVPSGSSTSATAATTLKDSVKFNCPASELYRFLTEPQRIVAWSRSPASALPQIVLPGAPFSLFGGNICGRFVEMMAPNSLVMDWKLKDWPTDTKVTIAIAEDGDGSACRIDLTQEGVPAQDVDLIRSNWHNYYWTPIKRLLGQL